MDDRHILSLIGPFVIIDSFTGPNALGNHDMTDEDTAKLDGMRNLESKIHHGAMNQLHHEQASERKC